MSSTSSASQRTVDFEPCAPFWIWTSPRYDVRPPPRATDLDTIEDDVFGAQWTIFEPASWCWPSPAKAMDSVSPLACWPIRKTAGYFMVTFDPRLPSIHSIVAPSAAVARL